MAAAEGLRPWGLPVARVLVRTHEPTLGLISTFFIHFYIFDTLIVFCFCDTRYTTPSPNTTV